MAVFSREANHSLCNHASPFSLSVIERLTFAMTLCVAVSNVGPPCVNYISCWKEHLEAISHTHRTLGPVAETILHLVLPADG